MPQLDWPNNDKIAAAQNCTFRSHHDPIDDIGVPHDPDHIRFNKLTDNDGNRYLDIAVNVQGRPAHWVLNLDQIEQLRAFLAGPDGRSR